MFRNTTVPGANPSAVVLAIASSASWRPRSAVTNERAQVVDALAVFDAALDDAAFLDPLPALVLATAFFADVLDFAVALRFAADFAAGGFFAAAFFAAAF